MTEPDRIEDQIKRAFEGDAWHGPATREVLAGVTAEQAASRHPAGAHTIWELVLHVTAWKVIVRRRLEGEPPFEPSPEEDWPPVGASEESDWQTTIEELERAQDRLHRAVKSFPESRLDETVAGQDYSHYVMLHGLVQHDLYHAGQIAILKKA
jgi:uncharacterized damage-inducible protein DinB